MKLIAGRIKVESNNKKSISTLTACIYNKFYATYRKNRNELQTKGVINFSNFITYMLEELMQKDKTFARYAPNLEKISINDDSVILKDHVKNRIIEVVVQRGELFCNLCDGKDCIHIKFVFSLPEVYEILKTKDISYNEIVNPIVTSRIQISKDRVSFDPEKMQLDKGYEFQLEKERFAFVRTSRNPTKIILLTHAED